MRVAFLSLLAPPGGPPVSGVPRVCQSLLSQYEKLDGISVDAISLIDGLEEPVVASRGHVCYHYLPCKSQGKTLTFYASEVKTLAGVIHELKPDVIHGHPSSEYLLAATRGSRPARVITIQGLVLREAVGLGWLHPGWMAAVIREGLQRIAIRRAQHIIIVAPYVEAYIKRISTRARLWPVPEPLDAEFFDCPAPRMDGLRILCVGSVQVRKNQRLLVETCNLLRQKGIDFECRIVGIITNDGIACVRLSEALGLQDKVKFLGVVSQEVLLECYGWANLVVLPSREDSVGMSLVQGMAASRVVLGARAGGIPSLFQSQQFGTLFDPIDPASLLDLIMAFVRCPDSFSHKLLPARTHVKKTFSAADVAARTVEIYRELSVAGRPTDT